MAQNNKLDRMRELMDEFDNPADALRVMRDLHREKAHKKRMDEVVDFGTVKITNWAALETYLETLDTAGVPIQESLMRASAEIQAAVATQDDSKLFGLLWLITKAVKPHNLYRLKGQAR